MRLTHDSNRRGRRGARTAAAIAAFALSLGAMAQEASDRWELRVCAPPQTLPFSHIDRSGFENKIIEMLAEEIGAYVTYEWVDFTEDLVNLHFAEGKCDVIPGVPDGYGRGLNTLTYYTSPFVMVYRADAGFDIQTLDDAVVQDLSIGIHGMGTPPHAALLTRGLTRNVERIFGGTAGSDDHLSVLVRSVADGEVDLGFGFGPGTTYWAARSGVELVVKPVEPMFEPPSTFQVQPMTMAVRREEHQLQRLLNLAIAARWDDIHAILEEYAVPYVDEPAPFVGDVLRPIAETVVDVGVVLPIPTGGRTYDAAVNDYIGAAALRGAQIAQGVLESEMESTGVAVVIHWANAPSPEAAVRAAERLVLTEGVDVIVGGVGEGHAEAIASVAAEHGVLFVDVASTGPSVRAEPRWNEFHVAPGAEEYLRGLVRSVRDRVGQEVLDWFVVQLDEPAYTELGNVATRVLLELGERVVDGIAVDRFDPTFESAYRRLEESGANAVLVLLSPVEQIVFMGGYRDRGGEAVLAPYPDDVTQTRNFLAANAEYGVAVETPRVLAWETTLSDGRAGDFNRRYTSRFGQPADPTAWTTYEGLRVVQQAAIAARSDDPQALAEVMANGTYFNTAKGSLAFDELHQLAGQTLYVAAIDGEAVWGPTLSEMVSTARLLRTLVPVEDPQLP